MPEELTQLEWFAAEFFQSARLVFWRLVLSQLSQLYPENDLASTKVTIIFKNTTTLFISLHVRVLELVILVKPIGILTHVFMSISFWTKIPTFLNIPVLLKVVGIREFSYWTVETWTQQKSWASLRAGSHLGAHARAAKSEFKRKAILRGGVWWGGTKKVSLPWSL